MFKKVFKLIRRIIVSSFLLYAYNLLVQPIGLIIPINIFTVGALTVFGIPAFLALIVIMVSIY